MQEAGERGRSPYERGISAEGREEENGKRASKTGEDNKEEEESETVER